MIKIGAGRARGHAVLSDAAAQRMANQLSRAYRGTFGAEVGLRTIAGSVATQLLGVGVSRAAAARALDECVTEHPERHATVPGDPTRARLVRLRRIVRESVASAPAPG